MNWLLFLGTLGLTMVLAWIPGSAGVRRSAVVRSTEAPRPSARAYRLAVLAGAGVAASVWCWLLVSHWASSYGVLAVVAGALAGGVVAAAVDGGLVENNAAPSAGVREKVLAYHVGIELRRPRKPRFKRAFDVVGALLGLVLTLPVWLIITVLIWFDEPGPIFFIKNSVGRGGVTFRQVKFRSMRYGAERSTGPVPSPANDPRTLRVGRFLRRWHLDELPELINVLGGTMSLVGPRPLRTVLVQRHLEEVPGYAERHIVKPGIACIAQIEKYYISPAERLKKDLAYIRSMSLALDLRLLGRAVRTTVRGERQPGESATASILSESTAAPTSSAGSSVAAPASPPEYRRGSAVPDAKTRQVRPQSRSRAGRRGPSRPSAEPTASAPSTSAPSGAAEPSGSTAP